jgi:YbgC/YbaW family acyl-CoA thioester hydrolase
MSFEGEAITDVSEAPRASGRFAVGSSGQPHRRSAILVEHVERTRVAWVDTDAGGRIHFTAAFRYAEAAETALMRSLGLLDGWGDFPRRRVEADFRVVLRFADELEVRIRPERVGRTSITWAWEILRDGESCIDGRHTVVHVDSHGNSAPLPDDVRTALTR